MHTLGDAIINLAPLSFPSTDSSVDDERITVALIVEDLSGGVSSSENGCGSFCKDEKLVKNLMALEEE